MHTRAGETPYYAKASAFAEKLRRDKSQGRHEKGKEKKKGERIEQKVTKGTKGRGEEKTIKIAPARSGTSHAGSLASSQFTTHGCVVYHAGSVSNTRQYWRILARNSKHPASPLVARRYGKGMPDARPNRASPIHNILIVNLLYDSSQPNRPGNLHCYRFYAGASDSTGTVSALYHGRLGQKLGGK